MKPRIPILILLLSAAVLFNASAAVVVPASTAGEGVETARDEGPVASSGVERPKVGLVLSGGGAKGVAHIRVLQVLEEAGMPIDYIAGTSIGAIMGGLYAIGYTPHELDSMVVAQDWMALLSDRVARYDKRYSERESADTYIVSVPMSFDRKFSLPSGITAGQNVLNLLNEMAIGYHENDMDFDKMPIPFACVAYDMVKGREHVFRKGNLPVAIRSSMSIPGAFAPVLIDSMVLVDGGIYNNFPVDVVREMGADIVIGVDLAAEVPAYEEINSIIGMLDQMTSFMGREKYNENLRNVDLYIKPDIRPYNSTSFTPEAIDTLLMRGETAARSRWNDIVALKERHFGPDYTPLRPMRSIVPGVDSMMVGKITFMGLSANEEPLIRRSLGIEENSRVTKSQLGSAIERLRGSGAFSYVTYTLDIRPPYDMIISVNEKQEAAVNLGFRFDSEEMASILLGSVFSFRGYMGPRAEAMLRLSGNPYFKLDLNSSRWHIGRAGLSYMFAGNRFTTYDRGENPTRVTFQHHKAELYMNNANPDKLSVYAGIQYERFNYQSFLFSTDPADMAVIKPKGFVNYFVNGYLDTMDDYYFPTRGYGANMLLMLHTDNTYRFEGKLPFTSVQYSLRTAISYNNRLSFIPSLYGRTLIGNLANKENYFAYMNAVGGELQGRYVTQQMVFPGVRNIEYLDHSVMVASLEVRMRLFRRHYISLKGAFGLQHNNFFKMFYDNVAENNIWGVGVKYSYNSPVGPLSIQFDTSNLNKGLNVYLSVGKNF